MGDFLFFKSLKDGRLSRDELALIRTVSTVVWFGLFLLVVSGIAYLFLFRLMEVGPDFLLSGRLWAKYTFVVILLINGFILHTRLYPILEASVDKSIAKSPLFTHRHLAAATGAVSIVSWYSSLTLGAWRSLEAGYLTILVVYLLILLLALIIGRIVVDWEFKGGK